MCHIELSLMIDDIEVLHQIDKSHSSITPISSPKIDEKEYHNLINQI